ncbi:MAG: phosphoglycerate kinase [Patescibacteria group bacterium]
MPRKTDIKLPRSFNLTSIRDAKNLRGKRVLLRLDLNVPLLRGKVADTSRIESSLPTLKFLRAAGARTVIISHLGNGETSLKEVARKLNSFITVGFIPGLLDAKTEAAVTSLPEGGILMLENLRSDSGEKENSTFFALSLSRLGDIYINDAFSASHRAHASIISLPKFLPGFIGLQFEREIFELSKSLTPKKPFLFIIGGAKPETKLPLIKKYARVADKIFVGGALMNSFFKSKGYEVGKSIAEDAGDDLAELAKNKNFMLPEEVVVDGGKIKKVGDIDKNDIVRDIGPKALQVLIKSVKGKKEIIFNGPLGYYELGFDKSTKELLKAMAKSGARTVVGGGDTLALVSRLKIGKKISFVSTGGGAMLLFLATGTLPGIEALKNK